MTRTKKRGERTWEDFDGDYCLHLPTEIELEQLVDDRRQTNDIIMVHGHACIIAADGRLERLDED